MRGSQPTSTAETAIKKGASNGLPVPAGGGETMIDVPSAQPAYTLAEWSVRPKAEDAFVKEWTEFSEWLLDHGGAVSVQSVRPQASAGNGSPRVWAIMSSLR